MFEDDYSEDENLQCYAECVMAMSTSRYDPAKFDKLLKEAEAQIAAEEEAKRNYSRDWFARAEATPLAPEFMPEGNL